MVVTVPSGSMRYTSLLGSEPAPGGGPAALAVTVTVAVVPDSMPGMTTGGGTGRLEAGGASRSGPGGCGCGGGGAEISPPRPIAAAENTPPRTPPTALTPRQRPAYSTLALPSR